MLKSDMKLVEFMSKHGSVMGYLETFFLQNVFFKDYGEDGLDLIIPEVSIDRNDGTDRKWRIDFVVTTKQHKYAIECDGYNYHAMGVVSRERFDELESKKNETVRQGYIPISFSKDQIINEPDEAIFQMRRFVNSDPDLYRLFLHWNEKRITPHDVQVRALNALKQTREKGNDRGLVVLATGLGKTFLSVFDVINMSAKNVLFVVHVDHILKQARNSFEKLMPDRSKDMGFFTGKEKDILNKKIVFSTVQTINKEKNLSNFSRKYFDYVIMDESHHCAAPSYKRIMEYFQPKFFLGLTATPDRMDKKNILPYYDNNLVFEMDQSQAIKEGYLANMNYMGFKDNVDYSNIYWNGFRYDINDLNKSLMIERRDKAIISKFKELASDRRTIGFCASIEHAEWAADHFRRGGIDAISIHSKINNANASLDYQSAEEILDAFDKGKHQVAFVVDMLNEGVDIPDVDCLLMLRPTESNTILTQQLGRGLRIFPNKKDLLVLDFIGNYKTSPKILESLDIKDLRKLKRDDKKGVYFYENEGRRVQFDKEVVDIFKFMISHSTKKVREELIDDYWKDYGNYLKNNTSEGVNLFWSVGKKNNDLKIHFWILDFVLKNKEKYKNFELLSNQIKKVSKEVFPNRTVEGIRGLFFSKLIGLIINTTPFELSLAYYQIIKKMSSKNNDQVNELISNQIEKFYFWNSQFSLVDRHSGTGKKRQVDKEFHLYPVYFVYSVLIKLNELGYKDNFLTSFEIKMFLSLARDFSQVDEIVDRIVKYREHSEKYELEKYLRRESRMDTRFYKILSYSQYLSYSPSRVVIKKEKVDELKQNVEKFFKLMEEGKLIQFDSNHPKKYFDMLYSKESLLDYHS